MEQIAALREAQAQRIATVKMQLRMKNQSRALARRAIGWQPDMEETTRAKMNVLAATLVKSIEKGESPPANDGAAYKAIEPFVLNAKTARTTFDAYRKQLEKKMCELAESLPVWEAMRDIRGFGSLGLAIIIGEAGDLGHYSNPAKLWKRLGLAVFGGKASRRTKDKELAELMGYNPRRRSAIWTIGDSLIKGNKAEYRQLYLDRKAYELERDPEMKLGHAHRRAQRYMEKRLVRNLWRAWRDS